MSATIGEIRQEAKRRGVPWAHVRAVYDEIKAGEWARRERPNDVRATAWACANAHAPGKWEFWRHGFRSQYGARVDRSDYTAIPRYDVLAQELAALFREYAPDDGCERLWEFLLSPYQRYPAAPGMYAEALEVASRERERREGGSEEKPKSKQLVAF